MAFSQVKKMNFYSFQYPPFAYKQFDGLRVFCVNLWCCKDGPLIEHHLISSINTMSLIQMCVCVVCLCVCVCICACVFDSVVSLYTITCLEHFQHTLRPRGLRGFCSGAVITGQGSFCPLCVPSAARCTLQNTHTHTQKQYSLAVSWPVLPSGSEGYKFQGPSHPSGKRKCVETGEPTRRKVLFFTQLTHIYM